MKTRIIKSALPIYIAAAVWILYGMALPLYRPAHILLAAGLSVVAYFAASKFLPGRKVEVPVEYKTGDGTVDAQLKECAEDLKRLRAANEGIASHAVTEKIDRMEKAGHAILRAVTEKPERLSQVRKFMKYYLPTAAKLLEQYRTLLGVAAGEQVRRAMTSVEQSLDLIAAAFEKQLDTLYRDDAMDIETDVKVLETMMAQEGLTGEGIAQAVKEDTSHV